MSTVTPSAAEYSRITPELMQLTGLWAEHAHIDRELYQRYNVKRGLRDANGRGVLASLTRISEVKGYTVDGDSLKEFEVTLGELTDDEREIILKGCLINYNRK